MQTANRTTNHLYPLCLSLEATIAQISFQLVISGNILSIMATVLKKTTCESLQKHLENWVALVDTAVAFTNPSIERSDAIMAFCKVFVPADVSEDDIDHFSGMLTTDEVTNICDHCSLLKDVNTDNVVFVIIKG